MQSIEPTITLKLGAMPTFFIAANDFVTQQELLEIAQALLELAQQAFRGSATEETAWDA